jgi:hypothetical protein
VGDFTAHAIEATKPLQLPMQSSKISARKAVVGGGDPTETTFHIRCEIDWVRVYQKK